MTNAFFAIKNDTPNPANPAKAINKIGPAVALNPTIVHTLVAFVNKKLPALLAKVANPCPALANEEPGFEKNAITSFPASVTFAIVLLFGKSLTPS